MSHSDPPGTLGTVAATTGTDLPGGPPPPDEDAEEDRPPLEARQPAPFAVPRSIKRGPALVFVGLAVLVGGSGFVAAALSGRPGSQAAPKASTHLRGVSLAAVPATKVLRPVVHGGEPPRDIAGALVVPSRTRETGSSCGAGLDLYSCTVRLAVPARPPEVVGFYRAELTHEGWKVLAVDATAGTTNGTEIYAQKGSSDGFYWEVGVRIEPVTPSITPALSGGSQSAPTSKVSLAVVERNDAD